MAIIAKYGAIGAIRKAEAGGQLFTQINAITEISIPKLDYYNTVKK